jgi:hypothetical protein
MNAAGRRQIPDIQHAAAFGIVRRRVSFPVSLEIQIIQMAAELALVVHHPRIDEALKEIQPVQRQFRIAVIIDDVGLAYQNDIGIGHSGSSNPL